MCEFNGVSCIDKLKTKQGILICFEGISGVGKSTQAELLKRKLVSINQSVFFSKVFKEEKRRYIKNFFNRFGFDDSGLDHKEKGICLFFLALFSKYCSQIKENLWNTDFVIIDRWKESFFGYNKFLGPMSGNELEYMRQSLADFVFENIEPDVTFFLDRKPEVAVELFKNRKRKHSYAQLNTEQLFHIRDHYLSIARNNPNWKMIRCDNKSIEDIHQEIWQVLFSAFAVGI